MSTSERRSPRPRRRAQPAAVEIYDTTLRDGSQLEGISLTVDDKLRIAEQLDHLGVHYIEGGWPGRQPQGRRVLPPGADRARPRHQRRWWPSAPPAGSRARSTTTRPCANLLEAGTGTVCIVGKCWDYHVTEALRTDLDEGVAMVGRLGRVPARRQGLRVFFDAEHFFDGYKAQPRVQPAGARGGGRWPAPTASCCATPTAARCPTRSSAIVGEVVDYVGRPQVGVHLHDDTGCGVANALAGVRGGATQVQGTHQRLRRAHRQLQPHHDHPQPHAEDGRGDDPRRAPRAAHPGGPPHRRAGQHHPRPPAALRRARRPSPTRRACTPAPSPGGPTPTSTSTPTRSATAPASWCPSWPAGRRCELKAQEIGLEIDGPALADVRRPAQAARARGLPLRGGRRLPRAAHAATPPAGRSPSSSSSRSGSRSSTEPRRRLQRRARRRDRHRGHGQGRASTASGSSPPPRATARSTPSTRALRKAIGGRATRPSSDVHLTDYKVRVLDTRQGHRRGDPGAASTRTDGERSWSTIGVSREHHRGVVAGPGRLDRLRPAPSATDDRPERTSTPSSARRDSAASARRRLGVRRVRAVAAPGSSRPRRSTTPASTRPRHGAPTRGSPDRPAELDARPAAGPALRLARARTRASPSPWPSGSGASCTCAPASTRTTPSPAASPSA